MGSAVRGGAEWTLILGGGLLGRSGSSGPVGLLASGERLVEVGPVGEVRPRAADLDATVIDLSDRLLLPGFVDAHNHQPSAARDRLVVETAPATSVDELLTIVRHAASHRPSGEWITTERNLTRAQLRERRYPTSDELSACAPDHPVAVRFGAHSMVLNRLAFERSGLARLAEPVGGAIERDGAGRPTGPIHEYGVTRAVDEQQPTTDRRSLVRALDRVQADYLEVGITTVRVPGVRPGELSWYQELRETGRWRMRAAACLRIDPNLSAAGKRELLDRSELRTGFGDDRLCLDVVKLFVDGGVGASDRTPTRFLEAEQLDDIAEHAVRRGWGVTCHAVSSEAIETVLTVYHDLRRRHGARPRLVIEHALFATEAQVDTCVQLDVWLSLQPSLADLNEHLITDGVGSRAPLDALTARRAGARVALGSDWNATPGTTHRPYAPLRTIGRLVGEHGVSAFGEGVELHTAAGGLLAGRPRIGRLMPGGVADVLGFPGRDLAEQVAAGEAPLPTDVIVGGQPQILGGRFLPAAAGGDEISSEEETRW